MIITWAKELNRYFFKEDIENGQWIHEKVFN